MTSFDDLPLEVQSIIINYLNLYDIVRFSRISTFWNRETRFLVQNLEWPTSLVSDHLYQFPNLISLGIDIKISPSLHSLSSLRRVTLLNSDSHSQAPELPKAVEQVLLVMNSEDRKSCILSLYRSVRESSAKCLSIKEKEGYCENCLSEILKNNSLERLVLVNCQFDDQYFQSLLAMNSLRELRLETSRENFLDWSETILQLVKGLELSVIILYGGDEEVEDLVEDFIDTYLRGILQISGHSLFRVEDGSRIILRICKISS